MNLSLFNGGLTTAQIGESQGQSAESRFNEEALKQNIELEVRQALLNLQQAAESIDVSAKGAGAGAREPRSGRGPLSDRRRQHHRAHRRAGVVHLAEGQPRARSVQLPHRAGGAREGDLGDLQRRVKAMRADSRGREEMSERPTDSLRFDADASDAAPPRRRRRSRVRLVARSSRWPSWRRRWPTSTGAAAPRRPVPATSPTTSSAARSPSTVTATGTVNPVTTVQVGTYVSGPISAIYVDFNSPVSKGQLVAKIDPAPFEVKVRQAEAEPRQRRAPRWRKTQRRSGAQAPDATSATATLGGRDLISQNDVDTAQEQLRSGRGAAGARPAPASSRRRPRSQEARINLAYTDITSPVDGVVVSRNVDVGQTVAASFQTPTLFLIAQDLTKMQVDANVSESDIGDVRRRPAGVVHRRRLSRPSRSTAASRRCATRRSRCRTSSPTTS